MGQGIYAFMNALVFFRQIQGYDYKKQRQRWHKKVIVGGIREAKEKEDT
jgi:hypothetical protein